MSNENEKSGYEKAMAYLTSHCAVNGVAAINFRDGEMFMFSRAKVEELKQKLDEAGSDEIIVFVQRGPGGKSLSSPKEA